MTIPTTVSPRLIVFNTEEELHDHAERLNEIGVNPDVPIMDSRGHSVLASRTAPGGDGWGFEYYSPGEDGFMHCCGCSECGRVCNYRNRDWKPFFPVTALVGFDLSGTEGLT
jgi:hypothetical protein